jgi:hypothetical protein
LRGRPAAHLIDGRRHTIIVTAVLSLFALPLWAFSTSAVWLDVGALLLQLAWGVIPVHLNELSARGTFPGFTYLKLVGSSLSERVIGST